MFANRAKSLQPSIVLLVATLALGASGACAQNYTVGVPALTPNIGNVASATSGDTIFAVAASGGVVTKVSGNGARISSGAAVTTITITCGNQNACNTSNVNVAIGSIGTPTNRAKPLANFTVAMGTASLVGSVSGTNPISFTLGPIPKNAYKTFYLGLNFPLKGDDTGLASGAATSSFYVYAIKAPSTPNSGATGTAKASVFRSLSAAKTSDLNFGRIVLPTSGSGQVVMPATTGVRAVTGGAGLGAPAPLRSAYTVTGEGGQVFTASIPATITLTNGSGATLQVTTSNTAQGVLSLSGSLGAQGTRSFYVGGAFPISSSTPSGLYSGSFQVNVNYN